MPSEDMDSNQITVTKVGSRFLGGAALGALIVAMPISYGSSVDLSLGQIGIASVTILSCGLLSSIWGDKFIDTVMSALNNTGL
jgi:hypothetical protein